MLNHKIFLKGIRYLNAYYTNFNFNINDDMKLEIWYDIFKETEDTTYTNLVKKYCIDNVYAPQSPTHLLQYAKNILIQNKMTPEAAWEKALGTLRETGYNFKRTYEKVENTNIVNSLKQMENELKGIMTKDIPFARNHFIDIYKREVETEANNQTKEGLISQLKITHSS
jgi:hypothetical protein